MPLPTEKRSDTTHKREALEELIQSDGFRLFVQHALDEWKGDGYVSRMGHALSKDDPIAAKVVHATSLEIVRLLQWPSDMVRELKGSTDDE